MTAVQACGCNELPDDGASIDFGTPTAGEVAFRTLRIANDNAPFELRLIDLELNDSTGIFSLVRLQRLSEDSTDATVETLDLTDGPWSIRNDELFELTIQVNPLTDATVTEELIVVTSSDRSPRWSVALNVGSGDGEACLPDGHVAMALCSTLACSLPQSSAWMRQTALGPLGRDSDVDQRWYV